MKLQEILDDIKRFVSRKKKKKTAADDVYAEEDMDEAESPNSGGSYASGSTGPIPGIKRNWVKGIAIFIVVVFVLAFMYGADEGRKGPDENPIKADSRLADADSAATRASDGNMSYEDLVAQDRARAQAARQQKQQPQTQATKTTPQTAPAVQAERTAPAVSAPVRTPVLPQAAPAYTLPQPAVASAPAQPAVTKSKQDIYGSSISFGMSGSNGNSQGGGSGDGNGSGDAQPSSTQLGASMLTASTSAQKGTFEAITPNTVVAGTIIPAMLLTGINTDTPGQIMAQIQSDVYDYDGYNVLIPTGSKLIGVMDSASASNGRVGITFTAIQTPDGGTWNIGKTFVAVDGAGYLGIKGKVHHHSASRFRDSFIMGGIAALGSMAAGNTSNRDTYSAGQIAAQGALANMINSASSMMGSNNVTPTVTVAPGYQFNVYVTSNITF